MPTYDYLCPNGHRFEVVHGVSAEGPASCPICGASPVRKAFTAPSIHFKGSGWAKKDRSATSKPAPSPAASSTSGEGASSGEAGSASSPSTTAKTAPEKPASGSGPAAD